MNKLMKELLEELQLIEIFQQEFGIPNQNSNHLLKQQIIARLDTAYQLNKKRIGQDIFVMPLENLPDNQLRFFENLNYKIVLQWVQNREPKKQVEIHIIEDSSNHKKQKDPDDLLKGNYSLFKKDIITQLHSVMYSDVQVNKERASQQPQKLSTRGSQIKLYQELFGAKKNEEGLVMLSDKPEQFKPRRSKPKYRDIKYYEVMESMFSKFDEATIVKTGYESIVNPYDPHDSQATFTLEIKDQLPFYQKIRNMIYQASIEKNKSLIFRQDDQYQQYPPNYFHLFQLIINLKTQLLNQDREFEYRVSIFLYLQRILAFMIMVETLKSIKKYEAKNSL